MANNEIWATIKYTDREILCNLVGKSFITGKRQAIPKEMYLRLSKEQREAARYILDLAQKCFGNIDYGMEDKK